MRSALTLALIMVVASLTFLASCGDKDEPSTERVSEIAGTWTATSATFNGTDVVAEGGSVILVIENSGRFTLTINRPERRLLEFTGRLGFDEEWLAVEYDTDPGEYEYYDITYDESNLHIGANSEFDFDGDGADEYVVFFLDMVR
jgi:hypothetical protein